ncbi:arginine methyltransferase 1 isoform X2 [Haemaphysalis longicornis]
MNDLAKGIGCLFAAAEFGDRLGFPGPQVTPHKLPEQQNHVGECAAAPAAGGGGGAAGETSLAVGGGVAGGGGPRVLLAVPEGDDGHDDLPARGDDLQGLLLRLVRPLRHPRGDAQGRGAHRHLPQLHVPQQAPLQGQGGAGRGLRHGHPEHVCGQGGRRQGVRHRVLGRGGARRAHRARERPRGRGHHRQGQGGGGDTARHRQGGHHHLRVDGLLPLLRVHARHGPLRARQVAETRGADVPGPGDAVPVRHRGPAVQGREDQLVGQRVRLQHELHPQGGHLGAPGGRGGPQAGGHQRLPAQGGGPVHGARAGPVLHVALPPASAPRRLHPGLCGLLQRRVHQVPQADGLLDGPRGGLHPLEADRLLLRRLHDRQEGRGDRRRLQHEAQPPQQEGPGLQHRHRLQGGPVGTVRELCLPNALSSTCGTIKQSTTRPCLPSLPHLQGPRSEAGLVRLWIHFKE